MFNSVFNDCDINKCLSFRKSALDALHCFKSSDASSIDMFFEGYCPKIRRVCLLSVADYLMYIINTGVIVYVEFSVILDRLGDDIFPFGSYAADAVTLSANRTLNIIDSNPLTFSSAQDLNKFYMYSIAAMKQSSWLTYVNRIRLHCINPVFNIYDSNIVDYEELESSIEKFKLEYIGKIANVLSHG